jgi:hypothetical protein
MSRGKASAEESEEERSPLAGACVLVVLAGVVVAVAFAIDEAVGVLLVVAAGAVALWRSARRVSDSSATPPPEGGRPSCRECAGHQLVSVTPLEDQKGMLIYKTAPPDRPNHTHIHVVPAPGSENERTP